MDFKIKAWQIFKTIFLLIISIVLITYLVSATLTVNHRVTTDITNVIWRSIKYGDVVFTENEMTWYTTENETTFTYEYNNGFAVAKNEDLELTHEFINLKEKRLYSPSLNTMFFHEDYFL